MSTDIQPPSPLDQPHRQERDLLAKRRLERQACLAPRPNPIHRRDTLCRLSRACPYLSDEPLNISDADQSQSPILTITYVPDHLVLDYKGLNAYMEEAKTDLKNHSLEQSAAIILDDVTNELVPRWVQICLTLPATEHTLSTALQIIIEDQQPGWRNSELLRHQTKI